MRKCKNNNCSELETPIIYENLFSYARLSNPSFNKNHILIMPKRHVENISKLRTIERISLDRLTKKLIKKLKKNPENSDFVIWENEGTHKTKKHFHRHLIPNNGKKPFPVKIETTKKLTKDEIEKNSKKIKSILYPK